VDFVSLAEAARLLKTDVPTLLMAGEVGEIEVRIQLDRRELRGSLSLIGLDKSDTPNGIDSVVPWQAGSAEPLITAMRAANNTMVIPPGEGFLSNLSKGEGYVGRVEIITDGAAGRFRVSYQLNRSAAFTELFVTKQAIARYKLASTSRGARGAFNPIERENLEALAKGMRQRWSGLDVVNGPAEAQLLAMMDQLPSIDADSRHRSRSDVWPNRTYVAKQVKAPGDAVVEKLLRKLYKLRQAGPQTGR
jgi:hypothetical protein